LWALLRPRQPELIGVSSWKEMRESFCPVFCLKRQTRDSQPESCA